MKHLLPIPPPHDTARQRFARNVRTIRRLRNISQEQLAFDADISRAYLSDVEKANRAVTIDVMEKISVALNVDLTLLLSNNILQSINS